MLNFVATDVYALFFKSFKKICNIHVQNEGGGVEGRLNNVKNCTIYYYVGFPNIDDLVPYRYADA